MFELGIFDLVLLLCSVLDVCDFMLIIVEDMVLLYFISGMMGMFKGVVYVYGVVVMYWVIGKYVLDLYVSDIYWCIVDFGWVIGMLYGIIVLLLYGVIFIVDWEEFDVECWYGVLCDEDVSVWYMVLMVICMLMKVGLEMVR